MAELPFKNLTIIGLGLIGGSLAMAARERFPDWHIRAVDTNPEALQYALRHQMIDRGMLTLPDELEEDHLMVIATHLGVSSGILESLAPRVQGRRITVTDVGSCKRPIMELGKRLLPAQFIAGHPMAGKELSGVENATSLLFANKAYLFCPHKETDAETLEHLKTFVQALGAIPRVIDADMHDRYMAYVSHLPQLYAILLTNLLYRHEPGHLLSYHGGGLDDQLRLGASPYEMWEAIFSQNRDNLTSALSELRDLIDDVLPLLDTAHPDHAKLAGWFARSNDVHRQFHLIRLNRQQSANN